VQLSCEEEKDIYFHMKRTTGIGTYVAVGSNGNENYDF
jgi:hypothetical protein